VSQDLDSICPRLDLITHFTIARLRLRCALACINLSKKMEGHITSIGKEVSLLLFG